MIITACVIIIIRANIPVILAVAVFLLLCGIIALIMWGASFREGAYFKFRSRSRFKPVPIFRRKLPVVKPRGIFDFSWVMLPFMAAALMLAIADLAAGFVPATEVAHQLASPLTEDDYRSHYLFQLNFSARSLNFPSAPMPSYEFASDGLPIKISAEMIANETEIPPFTLHSLLEDLNSAGQKKGHAGSPVNSIWVIFLPALFLIPALVSKLLNRSITQRHQGTKKKKLFLFSFFPLCLCALA